MLTTAAAGIAATAARAVSAEPQPKRLKKAVKFGMIKVPGASIEDKFNLARSLGFEGVELDSPSDVNRDEARRRRRNRE